MMPTASAKIKAVRPYRPPLVASPTNDFFIKWFQKKWKSRHIEIGCGAGLHPITWAKHNPQSALLAIERTQDKYQSFKSRTESHKLQNLWPLNQEALHWLPSHIYKDSIDSYYLLYPNPYPKEKQANKRWHRSPFFQFLIDTLKKEGTLHFATNEAWLADECLLYCENFWKLKTLKADLLNHSNLFKPRTHFEKKYLQRGETCYNLIFQKPDSNEKTDFVKK